MNEDGKKMEQAAGVEEIIRHYERVSDFLKAETIFRARPLVIVVDGPYSASGNFEVSLPGKGFTPQEA